MRPRLLATSVLLAACAPTGGRPADDTCDHVVTMELVEAPNGYNGAGRSLETTHYTADDRPLVLTWDLAADATFDWTETYTYDEDGNLLVLERTYGWGAVERDVYTYDEEGHRLTWHEDTGEGTTVGDSATYTYDALGQLSEEVRNNRLGDVWATTTYTYDDAGNPIFVETVFNTDIEGDVNTVTYTYDADGNVLTATWDDQRANGTRPERRYTYGYDGGDLVLIAIDDASNNTTAEGVDGVDDWFQLYENEAHRVVRISTHPGAVEAPPTLVETFTYDDQGRLVNDVVTAQEDPLRARAYAYAACPAPD